jgi:hypothetical protein
MQHIQASFCRQKAFEFSGHYGAAVIYFSTQIHLTQEKEIIPVGEENVGILKQSKII